VLFGDFDPAAKNVAKEKRNEVTDKRDHKVLSLISRMHNLGKEIESLDEFTMKLRK
jgi:hypothetical protein